MNETKPEDVMRALECCADGTSEACMECPLRLLPYPTCRTVFARDALALIRELTEENESLKEMNKALADGFETVKNGTLWHFIEKARLQAFCVGDEQYISLNELDEIMREV